MIWSMKIHAAENMLSISLCSSDWSSHVKEYPASNCRTIRCATVDNFQGEEAKVVIISLLRCNSHRNCGFLGTANRINVLLSKAMHGMYIIENAKTARTHVDMWDKVLLQLEQQQCVGRALELCCSRHPGVVLEVKTPRDFAVLLPGGGCKRPCAWKLKCGHLCKEQCHSTLRHDAFRCLQACERPQSGYDKLLYKVGIERSAANNRTGHACPRPCGDPCPT